MEEGLLSEVQAIQVSAVLEDCADQLHLVGNIIHRSEERARSGTHLVGSQIWRLLGKSCRPTPSKFAKMGVETRKEMLFKEKMMTSLREEEHALDPGPAKSLDAFGRVLRDQSDPKCLSKLQEDRFFVERVLNQTADHLMEEASYQTLVETVNMFKDRKAENIKSFEREAQQRLWIRHLQKEIRDVWRETEKEKGQRDEVISHLKDRIQQMNNKTAMERKYIEKMASVTVHQTKKLCQHQENVFKFQMIAIADETDREHRRHNEMMTFFKALNAELKKKEDFWKEKFYADKKAKEQELDILKQCRAKDQARHKKLAKTYNELKQVVLEARVLREKERRKQMQEELELKAVVKIQAFWRGVMVRKGLGRFAKKKKKKKKGKGKKGKRGKK